jgi:enoyl-CoA hydratase/carnithine racemase
MALVGAHERVTAERAWQLGILSEVVPDDRLRVAAAELAEKVANHPPDHLTQIKRQLWSALERP